MIDTRYRTALPQTFQSAENKANKNCGYNYGSGYSYGYTYGSGYGNGYGNGYNYGSGYGDNYGYTYNFDYGNGYTATVTENLTFEYCVDKTCNENRYSYCLNNPLIYTDPTGGIFDPISTFFLFFTKPGYAVQKWISPVAVTHSLKMYNNQQGIGIDVSVGLPQVSPISHRLHAGASYYWKYEDLKGNDLSGWETRYGGEAAIQSYMFAGLVPPGLISFGGTTYNSKWSEKQTTNLITFGSPINNMRYENDMALPKWLNFVIPLVPLGDGDRYRTAAAQINIGPFVLNTNMITGDAGPYRNNPLYQKKVEGGTVYLENNGYDPNKYRLGTLSFGVGPFRLGRNSESIRHVLQNKFAHDFMTGGKTKWFEVLPLRPRWYWGFGFGGATLW